MALTVSTLTLTAIAIERLLAVKCPLQVRRMERKNLRIIAVIWVGAVLVSVPFLIYRQLATVHVRFDYVSGIFRLFITRLLNKRCAVLLLMEFSGKTSTRSCVSRPGPCWKSSAGAEPEHVISTTRGGRYITPLWAHNIYPLIARENDTTVSRFASTLGKKMFILM